MKVYIQKLAASASVPFKRHPDDAGWDLFASREITVPARGEVNVPTDIAIAMEIGWCGFIRSRSSTLRRHGIIVIEGVIDAGYRGELFVQVFNPSLEEVHLKSGTRVAQIVFLPVPPVQWVQVNSLPNSQRGTSGFGSSGV